LDLTIKLTDIHGADSTPALPSAGAPPLLICDRCRDVEAIVVVTMQIPELEGTWSLCGPCKQELPTGFHSA